MKKRFLAIFLAVVMTAALLPTTTFAADGDFLIRSDGELFKYVGPGGVVTIPEGVTSIGSQAFYGCANVTKIVIPEGVTQLGNQSFWLCSDLVSVTIPASLTKISGDASLSTCTSLTDIAVAEGNSAYASQDGVLFNKDKTELICCPAKKAGAYTIPSTVTEIAAEAFKHCTELTRVTIPECTTTIRAMFAGCDIIVAAGNPAYTSRDGVLFNKKMTTLLQYPAKRAGVYIVPSSVTSIGNQAFHDCKDLTGVTTPKGVTSIEYGAFRGCTGLTDVTIP